MSTGKACSEPHGGFMICDECGPQVYGPRQPAYGPGHPEFDAKFRAKWLKDFRQLIREKAPSVTDEEFDDLIADFDKIREQFVQYMKMKESRGTDT